MLFDGCLLLSDIDGTLYNNGKIAPKNLERIECFKKNGGTFALCTGRNIDGAMLIARECGCADSGWLICSGGGTLLDLSRGEVVFQASLSDSDKRLFRGMVEQLGEIGAEVQSGRKIYVVSDREAVRWHAAYESLELTEASFDDIADEAWTKGLIFDFDLEKMSAASAIGKSLAPENAYFIDTTVGDGKPIFEFLPNGSKKSVAALKLKELIGAERLYAIGDYYNDIDMLSCADISACVAVSPPEVAKCADYTLCRCEDGAVAEFIDIIERLESGK